MSTQEAPGAGLRNRQSLLTPSEPIQDHLRKIIHVYGGDVVPQHLSKGRFHGVKLPHGGSLITLGGEHEAQHTVGGEDGDVLAAESLIEMANFDLRVRFHDPAEEQSAGDLRKAWIP
jgi:hypothetical protein